MNPKGVGKRSPDLCLVLTLRITSRWHSPGLQCHGVLKENNCGCTEKVQPTFNVACGVWRRSIPEVVRRPPGFISTSEVTGI